MMDEKRLLLRLKSGDQDALAQAIRLYTPYLSAVIYRAGGGALSREDQEELAADSFVALWQAAARLDPKQGGVRVYLAVAAKNAVYRRLHKQREDVSLDDLSETWQEPVAPDPDRLSLWDAVASLGEENLEIFVRFYRYGQSLLEISRAMGIKLSTVKTRLSRGKQKLKQILSDAEGII